MSREELPFAGYSVSAFAPRGYGETGFARPCSLNCETPRGFARYSSGRFRLCSLIRGLRRDRPDSLSRRSADGAEAETPDNQDWPLAQAGGHKFPGGNRGRVPPVPIPNTEVKPATADGTACVGVWESRSLPGLFLRAHRFRPMGSFCLEVQPASSMTRRAFFLYGLIGNVPCHGGGRRGAPTVVGPVTG